MELNLGLKLCSSASKAAMLCKLHTLEHRRLLLKTTQCPFSLCTPSYFIISTCCNPWKHNPNENQIQATVFRYPKCLGVQTVSCSSGNSQRIRKPWESASLLHFLRVFESADYFTTSLLWAGVPGGALDQGAQEAVQVPGWNQEGRTLGA